MTMVSEVAKRYASALFDTVSDQNQQAKTLQELRDVEKILQSNDDISKFFASPLVKGDEKANLIRAALENNGASEGVKNLATVMASRERIGDWSAVVQAFQQRTDEAHGVVRGTVRSAAPLAPDHRSSLEKRVGQVTGKKVILEYKQDDTLIGGLVTEVGSLTFDDSLDTQLKLMNESLKRSAH
jgi:F-type H+-transporting ATPase subunit delta